ncbi:MAG: hypothetical protein AAF215_18860 [Cyanobacteria bacterium P01_A01_bin.123]
MIRLHPPKALMSALVAGCLLGIPLPVITAPAAAQSQVDEADAQCYWEGRSQIVERFVTNTLLHRSWHYAQAGDMAQAVYALERTIAIAEVTTEPRLRARLIRATAGTEGSQPSIFEQVLNYSLATGQSNIPLALLPKIEAITQPLGGDDYSVLSTKTDIFVHLANTYLQLGQPEPAQRLFDQAWQTVGFAEGGGFAIMAVPIAEGYLALGETEQAIAVLTQAQQAAETGTQGDESYQAQIWSPMAVAYAQAGQLDTATQLAESIEVAPSKARTLASVAGAYAQADQLEQAEILFQQAVLAAQASNSDATLAQVALSYAQATPTEEAVVLVDQIEDIRIQADTFAALAAIYDQHNQPERAAELLNRAIAALSTLPFHTYPEQSFEDWIRDFAANNQTELILALVNSPQLEAVTRPVSFWVAATEHTLQLGSRDVALQIAEMIPPDEGQGAYRNSALQHVAIGYTQVGDYDRALQIIQTMESCGGEACQASALIAVAKAVSQAGQPDRALTLLDQADEVLKTFENVERNDDAWMADVKRNQDIWIALATQYVIQYSLDGQSDRAAAWQAQLLARIQDLEYVFADGFIRQSISDFIGANQIDLAIAFTRDLEPIFRGVGMDELAIRLLARGETERVRSVIDIMPRPEGQARLLTDLTDHAIGMGNVTLATDLLSQTLAVAQTIEGPDVRFMDEWDRASTFSAISRRYAALEQLTQAVQIAEMIADEDERTDIIQRLDCY